MVQLGEQRQRASAALIKTLTDQLGLQGWEPLQDWRGRVGRSRMAPHRPCARTCLEEDENRCLSHCSGKWMRGPRVNHPAGPSPAPLSPFRQVRRQHQAPEQMDAGRTASRPTATADCVAGAGTTHLHNGKCSFHLGNTSNHKMKAERDQFALDFVKLSSRLKDAV